MTTNSPRRRTERLIGQLLSTKENKKDELYGLLGTYDSFGNEVVEVENREGFVYVRIGGEFSELVEASNQEVSPDFDAKVILIKSDNGNFYEVKSRDLAQYTTWGNKPAYDLHALQHMFGVGEEEGIDPVFLYKRQLLQPMGVHPNPTGSTSVIVEADFYSWENQTRYFPGTQTVDFTPAVPSGTQARYMLVYLEGATNSINYVTGSIFFASVYLTGTADFIPEVSKSVGIPLAAIYLSSGTSEIDWDRIFDVREFLNEGGDTRASVVTVVDSGGYFTGTVVEDVLQELGQKLASGVYTPTVTGTANVDSNPTATEAQYLRVGNTVTVSGRFTANPTLTGTTTTLELSLPVTSNLGAVEDLAGVAFCGNIAGMGGEMVGSVANNRAVAQWKATDIASQTWSYTYTYQVI